MNTPKFAVITIAAICSVPTLTNAATTVSVSLWAYDAAAGNTPYYSHYSVTRDTNPNFWNGSGTAETLAIVNLLDSGWGFHPITGWSSYHVFTDIGGVGSPTKPARSVGWHNYEFAFNLPTNTATILMDGTPIHTGAYSGDLNWFSFNFNGHTSESLIDDFEVTFDGLTVYQQNFDSDISGLLTSGWYISRQDAGAYILSGDTSNPHTGSGALALGANVSGIVFDLNSISSVPEPGSMIAIGCFLASGLTLRRRTSSDRTK